MSQPSNVTESRSITVSINYADKNPGKNLSIISHAYDRSAIISILISISSLMLMMRIIWCRYRRVSARNCFTCRFASSWWNSCTYQTMCNKQQLQQQRQRLSIFSLTHLLVRSYVGDICSRILKLVPETCIRVTRSSHQNKNLMQVYASFWYEKLAKQLCSLVICVIEIYIWLNNHTCRGFVTHL